MSNIEKLSKEGLLSIQNYDEFFTLALSIDRKDKDEEIFNILFPYAISSVADKLSWIASYLLLELEPKIPVSCKEILIQIGKSKWDVSNKEVPFYLLCQFGKWNLLDEINSICQSNDAQDLDLDRIRGIAYWSTGISSELVKPFHYWEWEDVIEGKNA